MTGLLPKDSGKLSVWAVFVDADTLRIVRYHEHVGFRRDWASYAGLLLLAVAWFWKR